MDHFVAGKVYVYNGTIWYEVKDFTGTGGNANFSNVYQDMLYTISDTKLFVHWGDDPTLNWTEVYDFADEGALGVGSGCVYNDAIYAGVQFASFRAGMTYDTSGKIYSIKRIAW